LDGKELGRSRADAEGVAYWTAPGDYAGIVLIDAEDGKRSAAAVVR
jgi:hypothetical protein